MICQGSVKHGNRESPTFSSLLFRTDCIGVAAPGSNYLPGAKLMSVDSDFWYGTEFIEIQYHGFSEN